MVCHGLGGIEKWSNLCHVLSACAPLSPGGIRGELFLHPSNASPLWWREVMRMNLIMVYREKHTRVKHRAGLSTRRCTPEIYSDEDWKRPPDPTWSISWARSFDTVTSILSWILWAWLNTVFEKGISPWLQKMKRQRTYHLLCTQWLISLPVKSLCLISALNLASLPATSSWCAFLCYIKEPFSNWYLLPMKVLTCYNQAVF